MATEMLAAGVPIAVVARRLLDLARIKLDIEDSIGRTVDVVSPGASCPRTTTFVATRSGYEPK